MNTAQTPQNNQINYIELPLHDVAKTKAFYSSVFGWTFTDWGPGYISFEGAGINGGFNGEGLISNSGTGALVILYADDLEKTLANISRAGGEIVKPIYEFPGGKRFHFVDPNGNQLAVWSE